MVLETFCKTARREEGTDHHYPLVRNKEPVNYEIIFSAEISVCLEGCFWRINVLSSSAAAHQKGWWVLIHTIRYFFPLLVLFWLCQQNIQS